jgi:NAD(P)-dependent dehydrogenase (short-subunit alcohol dehydrogenase family)
MTVLDRFRLDGQVALVTGARKGIGKACARGLGEAGARVAISSRLASEAEEAASQLRAQGLDVIAVPGDVTSYEDVQAMASKVEAHLGPIDILVNNAGTVVHCPSLEVSPESWRSVLSVNLDAVWFCSQVVGNTMVRRRRGTIVNIGSISAYNASKAAVHQLTRSLAGEWAPYGVRVNALALGYVSTDMTGEIVDPERQRWWLQDVPMQRMAATEEVAPAVVFLASAASSFMTGSVMVLDGGYTVW